MTKSYVGFSKGLKADSQKSYAGFSSGFDVVAAPTGFAAYLAVKSNIVIDGDKAMKKNTASQSVGVQMINASDGSAFTGSASVFVTIDNGTQSAGGGAAPVHEGNGYHSYTPTQAETNGDHISFTFTGSGAVPVSVQVYTNFPQTGDNYTRLGAPAGSSVSADVAAVKSDTGAILVDTGTSGVIVATNNDKAGYSISGTKTTLDALNDIAATAIVSGGAITTSGGAVSNVTTVTTCTTNTDMRGTDNALLAASYTAPDNASISAILVDTGTTIPAQISALNDITAADVWSSVTRTLTSGANISLAKGVGLTGLNDISAADVLAAGDVDGYSLEEAQKLILSASAGVLAGAATNTITIQAADGSKTRITASVDADGNRTSVIKDAAG